MMKYQKKIKIAIVGDDFGRHGKGTALVIQKITEVFLSDFSNDLDVTLIYPEGTCINSIFNRAHKVEFTRKFSMAFSYLLFFIRHKNKYDAVIFNRRIYPGFWFLSARSFILIVHDSPTNDKYSVIMPMSVKLFDYFIRFIGKYFLDVIVSDSEDARKEVIKYYKVDPARVVTVYCGVEGGFRELNETEKEEVARRLDERYGVTSPYILDVSRLDPHKNIIRVLDAFFTLKEKHKIPHKLVLVGGRHTIDYSKMVEKKITSSPFKKDVLMTEYIEPDDMPALYNLADVLVFPSLLEGFGLPLVEAMRCGTPIVTSNISSMPEIVSDAAVLVDPFNTEAIQLALDRVLSDEKLRALLVSRGLTRGSFFSWKNSAGKFLVLFKQL